MNKEFRKIALVGLYADSRVAEPMRLIAAHLTKSGLEVLSTPEIAAELPVLAVTADELPREADLIVAVGGDGTMLHAASMAGGEDVPLLGVNRGRLGFLTDVLPQQMLENLDQILGGNYTRESRLRLSATLVSSDGKETTALALNDIVLQRRDTGRMLDFENTHRGVATSTPIWATD